MRKKRITRLRIPLEDLKEDERNHLKMKCGAFTIVLAKDPCLTCGHKKRVQYISRTDGKRELVRECLYCLTKNHTKANRDGP